MTKSGSDDFDEFCIIELVLCTYIWSKKLLDALPYITSFFGNIFQYIEYMLCMVMHPIAFLTRYNYIVLIQSIQNSPKSTETLLVIWFYMV